MKQFKIRGTAGESRIFVGECIQKIGDYTPEKRTVVITDEHVLKLHGKHFPPGQTIVIGNGEEIKSLATMEMIFDRLVSMEADRSWFLLGIGGGIVCDIAGFAASTYLRGIRFGFVPTTLLAQVDAGVGGKNGVNFKGYKNIIGVFNQPEIVLCDLDVLKTLPETEILCGLAEIVKHAVIADHEMFTFIEQHAEEALSLKSDVIERLVYDSVVIKSDIVNADEKEKGERRKLNFGHTFGHALEKTTHVPHGMAVSAGMAFAVELSVKNNLLSRDEADRVNRLLQALSLPTRIDADRERVIEALGKDKKREGECVHFVLLEKIGKAVVKEIKVDELKRTLEER